MTTSRNTRGAVLITGASSGIGRASALARPRTRYAVGTNARRMTILARLLPDRLLDRILLRFFGLLPDANRQDAAAHQPATHEAHL